MANNKAVNVCRTNLFTNFHIREVGYYEDSKMKPEAYYPEVSKTLEKKLSRFLPNDEYVHIYETNRDYQIAYQKGVGVRVSNVQWNSTITLVGSEWININE